MESPDGEDAAVATMAGEVLNSPDGSAALAASRFVQADQLLALGSATQRAPVGGVTGRGPVKPPQSWLAEQREEAAKAGAPPPLEADLINRFKSLSKERRRQLILGNLRVGVLALAFGASKS
jgi:hypothetical protein